MPLGGFHRFVLTEAAFICSDPDLNLDHNPHGSGGPSLDLNPVCLHMCKRNQSGSGSGSESPCKRG